MLLIPHCYINLAWRRGLGYARVVRVRIQIDRFLPLILRLRLHKRLINTAIEGRSRGMRPVYSSL